MRLIKMLGLAAVAALASMAFIGASSASADSLCHTKPGHDKECPAPLANGKLIEASSPETVLLSSSGDVLCESQALGKLIKTGNHATLEGLIETLTFSNCKGSCSKAKAHSAPFLLEVQASSLDVWAVPHPNLTHLLPGGLLEGCFGFLNCLYQTKSDLALVGKVEGDTLVFLYSVERSKDSAFCPSTGEWHAKYLVTLDLDVNNTPIYLALLP